MDTTKINKDSVKELDKITKHSKLFGIIGITAFVISILITILANSSAKKIIKHFEEPMKIFNAIKNKDKSSMFTIDYYLDYEELNKLLEVISSDKEKMKLLELFLSNTKIDSTIDYDNLRDNNMNIVLGEFTGKEFFKITEENFIKKYFFEIDFFRQLMGENRTRKFTVEQVLENSKIINLIVNDKYTVPDLTLFIYMACSDNIGSVEHYKSQISDYIVKKKYNLPASFNDDKDIKKYKPRETALAIQLYLINNSKTISDYISLQYKTNN